MCIYTLNIFNLIINLILGWKDGLAGKNTAVLAEDPDSAQAQHGGSQPSVTTIVGDWMPSPRVLGQQVHIWCIDTHASKIFIYIK